MNNYNECDNYFRCHQNYSHCTGRWNGIIGISTRCPIKWCLYLCSSWWIETVSSSPYFIFPSIRSIDFARSFDHELVIPDGEGTSLSEGEARSSRGGVEVCQGEDRGPRGRLDPPTGGWNEFDESWNIYSINLIILWSQNKRVFTSESIATFCTFARVGSKEVFRHFACVRDRRCAGIDRCVLGILFPSCSQNYALQMYDRRRNIPDHATPFLWCLYVLYVRTSPMLVCLLCLYVSYVCTSPMFVRPLKTSAEYEHVGGEDERFGGRTDGTEEGTERQGSHLWVEGKGRTVNCSINECIPE